ncbi:HAD family hydrolase [Rhodococcus sp. NPDC003318]|uniref:HAD family hydrolase n=1 Tax=Rhodococcus sp. NPDC003318 TaxID=3364503 RepID=UPI0036901A56
MSDIDTITGSGLQAVLWDMDGTLLESENLWDTGLRRLSEHLGGPMTEETREATIGSSTPFALATVFDSLGLVRTPQALAEARTWLYSLMGEMFAAGLPWRPGAREALGLVRSLGLGSVLVTNTERELCDFALGILGREHFDHSVCGDEVPAGKPDPAPYLRAAELLDVDPGRCLAVEDSPTGAASAEAAGCTVLVVPSLVVVPAGPRRVFRDTLVGLTAADLPSLYSLVTV